MTESPRETAIKKLQETSAERAKRLNGATVVVKAENSPSGKPRFASTKK